MTVSHFLDAKYMFAVTKRCGIFNLRASTAALEKTSLFGSSVSMTSSK